MGTFRKRPTEIEAVQFTGDNWSEMFAFCGNHRSSGDEWNIPTFVPIGTYLPMREKTAEELGVKAELWVSAWDKWVGIPTGEWVLKDYSGLQPCKPEAFERDYVSLEADTGVRSGLEEELANAIRLTVEYVGNDWLPAIEGWSWYDALVKYDPAMARPFVENPLHFPTTAVDVVTDPVLFDGRHEPRTLSEVIGQGVGAGSACWDNLSGAGVFESTRAKTIVDEILNWIHDRYTPVLRTEEYDPMATDFPPIGPECFSNKERTVISWKGENFYKACDALVVEHPDGGASHCVKRVGHPSIIHESFDGTTVVG